MNITQPPPPLDDESVTNPLDCPPLRWGLLGCGRVSHDFAQALKHVPTATVAAVAARSSDSAKAFADKHGVSTSYGSYDELIADENVDIVYVGNITSLRRKIGEKCLLGNKHVLLEKPFACSADDAKYLIGLAKERNLFLMEGMWTRFFPAIEQARRAVFGDGKDEKGVIGEVVMVQSDFNFNASDSEVYPTSPVYKHDQGGGSTFLVAPYPIAAALLFFKGAEPDKIAAVGQMDPNTGVDLQATVALSFPATSNISPALDDSNTDENTPKLPGAGVASLSFGLFGESVEETVVIGTKGRLTVCSPAHCPTKVIVIKKATGRGEVGEKIEYEFPLPADTDEIEKAGGYNYPNSAGFAYEAAAVARCIDKGWIECPQNTLSDTMNSMKLIDEIKAQLGVKPLRGD
mmetsp:Transcript_37917/g.45799  ORF Transcript_37917/g.45799 Transcript_37917/m.45799 type:complete len:404 (-) Transcript_37917:166-1377(-)